jgi:hypothetical protein
MEQGYILVNQLFISIDPPYQLICLCLVVILQYYNIETKTEVAFQDKFRF